MPQGSVLGPPLFIIFINDMPKVVHHLLKLFADDSKLIGIIKNQKDIEFLQDDLDALSKWAKDWRMLFHPEKCKVMELSRSKRSTNTQVEFSMEVNDSGNRHILAQSKVEKDLGLQITYNLKFDIQAKHAAAKA